MTRAIKSEFRKLFTTRLWWGMAIGIFLAGAAMAALFAFVVTASTPGAEGTPRAPSRRWPTWSTPEACRWRTS
ncbi:hypothetical protein GCM10025862_27180 [Arsenicicoccus piscis]|uniref:Uncharacterized protein n=2 Tax=Arsenicicoccus piscis TaxID=673954 RepID=A0ABQ6HQR3_9MICO|nr:hypothetical protein GCM10025862_27180 [Arsenicicoccus piscis]